MSRAGLYIGTVIAVVAVVAGYFYLMPAEEGGGNGDSAQTEGRTFEAPSAMVFPVTASRAGRGRLVMQITATGMAEAERVLNVAAEVDGTIAELPVAEGDLVEPGDLLLRLDDSELVLERDRAQEQLLTRVMDFTERQLEIPGQRDDSAAGDDTSMSAREFLQSLMSEQGYRVIQSQPDLEERLEALSREDLFKAQAELTNSTVTLRQAELNLARTRVTAPFEGRLSGLEASSGPNRRRWPVVAQRINRGTELMMLVDDDPIRLRVEVIESESSLVHVGRRAEVTFHAYPGETFTGTIESVSPLVDPDARTLTVTVRLPNPDGRIKPGMFASVVLDTEIFEDRLLVPASAVLVRNDRPLVFVVVNGRAQWVYITKGLENDQWIEVLPNDDGDGVAEGDIVITDGHFTLAHDTAVSIANELEEPTGGLP